MLKSYGKGVLNLIKLNHLPKGAMDLVMETSRITGLKPDQIIIAILLKTSKEDAKRAVDEHREKHQKIL
jgi:hypothetical protein